MKRTIKTELSTLEIFGAEALFNISLKNNVYDEHPHEELFLCGGMMNSTSDANGCPVEINGANFSHCVILDNGCLVAVCYDVDDNASHFLIEENGIYATELDV